MEIDEDGLQRLVTPAVEENFGVMEYVQNAPGARAQRPHAIMPMSTNHNARARGSKLAQSNTPTQPIGSHMARTEADFPDSELRSEISLDVSHVESNLPSSPGSGRLFCVPSTNTALNTAPLTPVTCSARSDTVVGSSGDMRYFGPPSGVSLTSIGAAQKPVVSTPVHSRNPSQNESWTAWTHPCLHIAFENRPQKPLPPWKEALSLVTEFFDHEHQAIPCFHQPAFIALLGQQYSGKSDQNPSWLASLHAVLAITQRRRVERGQDPAEKGDLAWAYAANAMGKLLDILMRNTQLLSVQALISMAWFFVGTPNPQPSFMLTGSALRLAHSIGLHTSYHDESWDATELEMRRRVFWIALSLDSELCLRTGRPPAHNLHDFQVDLPEDNFQNNDNDMITTANGSILNLFNAQCQLTIIQGQIYKSLYSSQPPSNEMSSMANSVSRLNQRLEDWVGRISSAFNINQPLRNPEHQGLMRLCYVFHNCVIVTNRGLAFKDWAPCGPETVADIPPIAKDSINRCLNSARSILNLNQVVPHKWRSFYWDIIGINSSAIIILCINMLCRPSEISTADDLRAINYALKIFDLLNEENPSTYLHPLQMACERLYRKAQAAVRCPEDELSLSPGPCDFRTSRRREASIETPMGSNHLMTGDSSLQIPETVAKQSSNLRNNSPNIDSQSGYNLEQPFIYPYLTPWSLDMLMNDSFPNFY